MKQFLISISALATAAVLYGQACSTPTPGTYNSVGGGLHTGTEPDGNGGFHLICAWCDQNTFNDGGCLAPLTNTQNCNPVAQDWTYPQYRCNLFLVRCDVYTATFHGHTGVNNGPCYFG